jgi:hypothetical protein
MVGALHRSRPGEAEYTFAVNFWAEGHYLQRIAGQQGEAQRDRQD